MKLLYEICKLPLVHYFVCSLACAQQCSRNHKLFQKYTQEKSKIVVTFPILFAFIRKIRRGLSNFLFQLESKIEKITHVIEDFFLYIFSQ